MKLLFILNNSKLVGGGDYSIFKFAEYLAKRGNEAVIFTTTSNAYTGALEGVKNLKIHYRGFFPHLFKGAGVINRIWTEAYTKLVIKPFVKANKDINFIIGYHRLSTIKANKLAKKFGIPSAAFVFETPDWMESQLKERWKQKYKGRFRKSWLMAKEELKSVDIIFPNSDLTKREHEKWLNRHISGAIYPGLDAKSIDKVKNIKKKYQIVYVGRLNAYKNVDLLIKALAIIKNHPKLVICGDGEQKEGLIKLAKSLNVKCDFNGIVAEDKKWIEIKKSLFMVFPTSFEGFGMPPMEALYCGIPCICSDIPILKEVYQNKVEYFKENDLNDLIKKIRFLLNNPKYSEKRGKEGRIYIKNKYSWEKSAGNIEKILKSHSQ